jgi:hypothetical protein
VIGPPDFFGDSLGVLLLVARLALEDFAPPLRAEVLRERPVVEPAFRAFPREPPFPTRFVFVWAICPSPKMKSSPTLFAVPQRSGRTNELDRTSNRSAQPGLTRPYPTIWAVGGRSHFRLRVSSTRGSTS